MTEPPDRGELAPASGEEDEAGSSRSSLSEDESAPKHRRDPGSTGRQMPFYQELALLLAVALVLAIGIKSLFLQAFYIPSGSMNDTLVFNDRILVQKVSYWGSASPRRGDVVVFEDPGGWLDRMQGPQPRTVFSKTLEFFGLYPTGGHLVKRVIGVAGDTIECCDDQGRLLVNGVPFDSSAFTKNAKRCDGPMIASCKWKTGPVPDGYLFVMGDHRDESADSTVHICRKGQKDCVPGREFVATDLVVGKVFARVWPLSRFKLLEKPDAFGELD